jgi:adenosine deaminase
MDEFIRGLPKAELHVHIEGTLEPELAFQLAAKHGVRLPYESVEELRRGYQFSNLQSFLDIYYAGAAVLRDEEDFYLLTQAYLRKAHSQGVVHTEMFFDPQTHTVRGVSLPMMLGGMRGAMLQAERELGMSSRVIMCFLRHLSASDAMRTLEQALPHKHDIAAVGLDSSEYGHPPAKFAEVFARARRAGWPAVAHAGEEGPASYIRDALDVLDAVRIDHGVRCQDDEALMQRLLDEQIPLTMCPLSNIKLRVFDRMDQHNIKRLLERGLRVTINSDDPAYFGGYILENYRAVEKALGLSRAQLKQLAENSIQGSFLPEPDKRRWLTAIRQYDSAPAGVN